MRVWSSGLATLPIGLLVLAASASARPPTYAGCFYPTDAALDFTAAFFEGVELSLDPQICQQQCKDFRKGCTTAYKDASGCILSADDKVQSGRARPCKELQGSLRKDCENDITALSDAFQSFIDGENALASAQCGGDYGDCLARCNVL
jgi:hypothetical protein